MGVHESRSLFFESQLGRSRPFIAAITPLARKHLGNDAAFDVNNMHKLYTRVEAGLIRLNADEVTYPLHVILRYEIERDLILGKVEVQDIPELWAAGLIGYFPSYTLGAMNAAQLHHAMVQETPNAPELVGRLDLEPIFDWLAKNVWQQGRLYEYDRLMTEVTGEVLNPHYFLDRSRGRYL